MYLLLFLRPPLDLFYPDTIAIQQLLPEFNISDHSKAIFHSWCETLPNFFYKIYTKWAVFLSLSLNLIFFFA